jgi:hypothetical protein
VVSQRWRTSTTDVDRNDYSYDRLGNCTEKTNTINAAYSEYYSYDAWNQLSSMNRNSGARTQSFGYDAVGNWTSVTTNGSTQTRSANMQNEYTSVSGASTPTFDANGNQLSDENGQQYVYDAWNRLKVVKNSSGTTLVTYHYSGAGSFVVRHGISKWIPLQGSCVGRITHIRRTCCPFAGKSYHGPSSHGARWLCCGCFSLCVKAVCHDCCVCVGGFRETRHPEPRSGCEREKAHSVGRCRHARAG